MKNYNFFLYSFQGTSRLISTDSEEVIRSPSSQSPPQLNPAIVGSLTSTAELLAVLSEDIPAQEATISEPVPPVPAVTEHKPEGIKIKIKKNLAQAFVTSNGDDVQPTVQPVARRNTRATRRTQVEDLGKIETVMKDNSPQPGNDNYELYRTLASPIEDKDFDSQSSVLGSISSVCVPMGVPEDSQVIVSRGSSHVSSVDADDQETSQDSSLMAAPSEVDVRLSTMMDCEVEKPTEVKISPKRNTRSRAKSPQPTVSEIIKSPEPEVMERRSTRNNNNGMLQVS